MTTELETLHAAVAGLTSRFNALEAKPSEPPHSRFANLEWSPTLNNGEHLNYADAARTGWEA